MAVVERFEQELMYGLSAGTKKSGRCREVAVVERWPLVEVRLYIYVENYIFSTWRKVRAVGIFVNDSNYASWLLGLELRRRQALVHS